ncbi:head-tail connector protein [Paracoccus lutimaris]|uniref:Gp6-like head-tail connector protein n=1 Tax=Paracoccus lutimaris TaxID=1490030 RepID=A0A368YXF4_9RHOB|nr:head-tail connector protein [Paracoccus lutimaris]RCW84871.1 gp6-like head-tail connector protein [Paracoccus lutimaris]
MSVPLALVRAHLNLEPDADGDLLNHYSNVAAAWIAAYTGQPFAADNPLMVQAALLMVAAQYESREAIIFSNAYQIPFGVHDLLSPLKERVTGHQHEAAA